MARSRIERSTSMSVTLSPEEAAVCAMPLPIVPAPMTTMFFTRRRIYHVAGGRNRAYDFSPGFSDGQQLHYVWHVHFAGHSLLELRSSAQAKGSKHSDRDAATRCRVAGDCDDQQRARCGGCGGGHPRVR